MIWKATAGALLLVLAPSASAQAQDGAAAAIRGCADEPVVPMLRNLQS